MNAVRANASTWSAVITRPRYGDPRLPSLQQRGSLEPLDLERLPLLGEDAELLGQPADGVVVAGRRGDLAVQRRLLHRDPLQLLVDAGHGLARGAFLGAADPGLLGDGPGGFGARWRGS